MSVVQKASVMPRLLFARCKMIVLEMIGDFWDQAKKSMSSGIDVTCLTIGPTVCGL